MRHPDFADGTVGQLQAGHRLDDHDFHAVLDRATTDDGARRNIAVGRDETMLAFQLGGIGLHRTRQAVKPACRHHQGCLCQPIAGK